MLYNEIIAKYQQSIGCHFEARLLKNMRKKPDHQKVKNISLAAYLSFDQTSFPSPPPPPFFNFSGCQEGSSIFDQCSQRCTCIGGKLVNCVRIRKEFTSMTFEERARYIRTIKTASTDPRLKTDYDNLLNSHRILFLSGLCTPHIPRPLVTV